LRTFPYIALICSALFMLCLAPVFGQEEETKEKKGISKYNRANAEYLLIEAQKFFLLEDYERSLAFLDQSIEVDPKNHAAYFKKAETFLVTEKYDQGLESIKEAQALQADNKYYYILAAQLYKGKEDLKGAAREYELMLSNTIDHKEFLLDIVDVYVTLEEYDNALKTLETTEKAFGTPNKFMLQKKDLLVQAGRSNEAIDYLKTLLEKDQDNKALLTEYSALMSNSGRDDEIITYLEGVTPTVSNATPLLLKLYLRTRQFDKANPLLSKVLDSNSLGLPEKIELAADMANLTEAESLPLLQALTDHIVAKAPNNTQVLEIQGQLLTKLAASGQNPNAGDLQSEAFDVLVKLKESDPASFNNWKRVLDYEFDNNDWQALYKDAEASLDYFPNQGLFYFYYGSASLYTGELDDAADLLSQAARLSASNDSLKARTLGKMAELAFAQNDLEVAQNHFIEALATLRLPEIINNYSFELALRQINPGKALELAEEASTMRPDRLKYIATKAFVQFQQGSFAAARQLLESGISRLPQQVDGPSLEQYGDVLMKLNLVDEAIEQWQKAKKLGKTSEKLDQKIANKEYF